MAVTTTVRQLVEAAYGKSLKNRAGAIASESGELYEFVIRVIRGIYAGAARINPGFFGAQADVAFAAGGWARPEGAQMIYRIEAAAAGPPTSIASGTEIKVLPFDQRRIEPAIPSVYRWAQVYKPVSASATVPPISPQNGTLTFFYSKRPATPAPASFEGVIDSMWVEDFNELLILRIARYLAIKDGRGEEVAGLTGEIGEWANQFIAFLEHETVNETRSYGHIARFNAPSVIPILSLIAGPAKESTG